MAICLDEFQQITQFNGGSTENVIRNQVQQQRQVGYVFAGSQPSLIEEMLSASPFHKAVPQMFLDKIDAADWKEFITAQFKKRSRTITDAALAFLLTRRGPYPLRRAAYRPRTLGLRRAAGQAQTRCS